MRRLLDRIRFSGIRGQIALLVAASLIGTQLLIAATFLLRGPGAPPIDHSHTQLEVAMRLISASPPQEREHMVEQIGKALPRLGLKMMGPMDIPSEEDDDESEVRDLARWLGPLARVFELPDSNGRRAGIALPDGTVIAADFPAGRPRPPFREGPLFTALIGVILSLALFGWWADRSLSQPLSSFAKAAENFKLDGTDEPLAETGPDEIRALARALNRSRIRITTLLEDRTRTLLAISHDLRTPITRLRLRSEFIEDVPHRDNMLHDLDQMRAMLDTVLSFLRTGRKLEPTTRIDLASTLQLVADQFSDLGHKVCYQGPDHAEIMARPEDIDRAVTNLVGNAVRYGCDTTVRLVPAPSQMVIEVEDDGPGIPDHRKAAMLEPFVRGDDARNMDEASGFGLGLAIARTIAREHGGELTLHDTKPHGLIARITLPRPASGAES
ncbi:ATP-binding protein [Rhodopseudomonas sp. B29]|uniref:ATP-binding protein n=1 Tax=Rhodopseudomonas sp. B29 TaxID=95607 RepID=UPI000347796A|nr:ATP-binding protein [Rhodopseudomonas sp. B29]